MRLSYATAALLGLAKGKISFEMPTAYIMIGEKCVFSCQFCAQSQGSDSAEGYLSRIKWPICSLEDFKINYEKNIFKRYCLQVVSSRNYDEELLPLLEFLKEKNASVSVSLRPKNIEEVDRLITKYNADKVGIPLDASTPELFHEIRGGTFDYYHKIIEEISFKYPNKITTHMIIGLGETDKNAIDFMYDMKNMMVTTSLFAFTPVSGTPMEKNQPPEIDRYRKLQYARELIYNHKAEKSDFVFDIDDTLLKLPDIDFNMKEAEKTVGCPWCSRPYYNDKPGKTSYNNPNPRKES